MGIIKAYLGGGEDFISENLTNALDGSEGRLSGSSGDEVDSLVNSSQGWNVDGLSSDNTTWTDSSGVFSGTTVGEGINEDLEGVLTGLEVDELKSLLHDSDSQLLLAAVSTLHHQWVQESLYDWAVHFLETSLLVSSSSEWQINLSLNGFDVQVCRQRDVFALDALIRPFAKEFNLCGVLDSVLSSLLNFYITNIFRVSMILCGLLVCLRREERSGESASRYPPNKRGRDRHFTYLYGCQPSSSTVILLKIKYTK